MKKVNAEEVLALDITEHALNVEFKEVRINGEYSATVGSDRAVPTFEQLLDPFVKLSNGMQTEFNPTVNLMRSSHGAEGTLYNISMPFGTVDLGGRSTECRISRFGSLNSSCSDKFGLQMLVQICSNGMMGWKSEGTAVTRFTANWQGLSNERIQFALDGFSGMKQHYIQLADDLKAIRLSAREVESGKGNRGENSWDLFNAVTEYENHFKSYRNTNGVSSDENRAKGVLSIDTDKLAELVA